MRYRSRDAERRMNCLIHRGEAHDGAANRPLEHNARIAGGNWDVFPRHPAYGHRLRATDRPGVAHRKDGVAPRHESQGPPSRHGACEKGTVDSLRIELVCTILAERRVGSVCKGVKPASMPITEKVRGIRSALVTHCEMACSAFAVKLTLTRLSHRAECYKKRMLQETQ